MGSISGLRPAAGPVDPVTDPEDDTMWERFARLRVPTFRLGGGWDFIFSLDSAWRPIFGRPEVFRV